MNYDKNVRYSNEWDLIVYDVSLNDFPTITLRQINHIIACKFKKKLRQS